jgi:hypothetical protein
MPTQTPAIALVVGALWLALILLIAFIFFGGIFAADRPAHPRPRASKVA